MSPIVIKAAFDHDASVWYVSESGIPGLATEAESFDALREKLLIMVPELLEANGIATGTDEISIEIIARDIARIRPLVA